MLPSPPNTRNQPLKREPSESVLTQRKLSRRAAATYQEAVFGGAPELAQLLPHAPLEQLLAGGGEDGLEAAAAVARRVHRGGGFQNPSPRNPRSSPKRSRGRLERGARAGPAAATVLSEPPRGREPSAAWRRGDRLTRRQAAATRGDWG